VNVRGRFDCGKGRAHYVVMKISCEAEWHAYREVVSSSNVTCLEVVAEGHRHEVEKADLLRDVKRQMVEEPGDSSGGMQ